MSKKRYVPEQEKKKPSASKQTKSTNETADLFRNMARWPDGLSMFLDTVIRQDRNSSHKASILAKLVATNNMEAISILLENYLGNYQDALGNTVLHYAVIFHRVDIVRLITTSSNMVLPGTKNNQKMTPLHLSASSDEIAYANAYRSAQERRASDAETKYPTIENANAERYECFQLVLAHHHNKDAEAQSMIDYQQHEIYKKEGMYPMHKEDILHCETLEEHSFAKLFTSLRSSLTKTDTDVFDPISIFIALGMPEMVSDLAAEIKTLGISFDINKISEDEKKSFIPEVLVAQNTNVYLSLDIVPGEQKTEAMTRMPTITRVGERALKMLDVLVNLYHLDVNTRFGPYDLTLAHMAVIRMNFFLAEVLITKYGANPMISDHYNNQISNLLDDIRKQIAGPHPDAFQYDQSSENVTATAKPVNEALPEEIQVASEDRVATSDEATSSDPVIEQKRDEQVQFWKQLDSKMRNSNYTIETFMNSMDSLTKIVASRVSLAKIAVDNIVSSASAAMETINQGQ